MIKKIIIGFLAFAAIFLISFKAFSFVPPEMKEPIIDLAGKLSQQEKDKLNLLIKENFSKTGNQTGVLVLDSLSGETIEDVAYVTFNSWKLGQLNKDNGVLIVIAVKDRKSRIETGKGVGGEITDIQASEILKNNLNPYLKKGDYYSGLNQTIVAIQSLLDSRKNNQPQTLNTNKKVEVPVAPVNLPEATKSANHNDDMPIGLLILFGVGMPLLFALLIKNKQAKDKFKEQVRLAQLQIETEEYERKRRESNLRFEKERVEREKARQLQIQKVKEEKKSDVENKKTLPASIASHRNWVNNKTTKENKYSVMAEVTPTIVSPISSVRRDIDNENRLAQERRERQRREQEEYDNRRREEERVRKREEEEREAARRDSYTNTAVDIVSIASSMFSSDNSPSSKNNDSGWGGDGGESGGGGASSDW